MELQVWTTEAQYSAWAISYSKHSTPFVVLMIISDYITASRILYKEKQCKPVTSSVPRTAGALDVPAAATAAARPDHAALRRFSAGALLRVNTRGQQMPSQ